MWKTEGRGGRNTESKGERCTQRHRRNSWESDDAEMFVHLNAFGVYSKCSRKPLKDLIQKNDIIYISKILLWLLDASLYLVL